LRADFDGATLRRLARTTKNANQSRRLLALAEIYDGSIFESYNEIVDHCCDAWNKLIDQPARIKSIGLRQWAHEC